MIKETFIILLAVLFTFSAYASGPPTTLPSNIGLQYHVHHVALRVSDLQQSVEWWGRVMGAKEVRRSQIPNISENAEIVLMHISGGFHIELIGGGDVHKPEGLPPLDIIADYGLSGWKHAGFYVADMDQAVRHLQSQNVQVSYRTTREDYGVEIVLFKEPNGYFIEFYAPIKGGK